MRPFAGRKVTLALPSASPDGQPSRVTVTIGKDLIKFSLRTGDRELGKRRHAAAWEQINRQVEVWKAGPKPLSRKEISALAGRTYKTMVSMGDNPGRAADWKAMRELTEGLLRKDHWRVLLSIGDKARRDAATAVLEQALGKWAASTLEAEGIITDAASRELLMWDLAKAIRDGSARLEQNADGDYSPDTVVARYPEWEPLKEARFNTDAPVGEASIKGAFEKWVDRYEPAASTVSTFRGHVNRFVTFIGHDDLRRVTRSDALRWVDALQDEGIQQIKKGPVASLRVIFEFAKGKEIILSNPFESLKVTEPKRRGARRLPYTDNEVAQIVALARLESKPALRWMPELMAYSGARVGEIAQLWGQRIQAQDGRWVMQIAPAEDGGSLKNDGSERVVPIHSALVGGGFIDFVKARGSGPLFYGTKTPGKVSKAKNRSSKHASKGAANRLASWIKSKGFNDPRKDRTHAFRHWFKTMCQRLLIPDSVANAIQGHAGSGMTKVYGHLGNSADNQVIGLEAMAEAIEKITIPNVSPETTNAPPEGPPSPGPERPTRGD